MRYVIPTGLLCLLLVFSGCAANATLQQVMTDPGRYRNKPVTLTGVVDKPMAVAGQGVYRISDGDAHLWVKTTRGVPQSGTVARVTGRIYDAYDLAGMPFPVPEGIRRGMILLESSRRSSAMSAKRGRQRHVSTLAAKLVFARAIGPLGR